MEITIRPKEDQNIWNFLLSTVFVILAAISMRALYLAHGGYPLTLSWFDALIIVLAVFRLTRLMVYDKMMRFVREWFVQKKEIKRDDGTVVVELMPYPRGLRLAISNLLGCPWCFGVWAGLLAVFAYFEYPWAWYVLFVLAVAGLGSLLQILANRIGWNAELSKLSAHAITKEKESLTESTC